MADIDQGVYGFSRADATSLVQLIGQRDDIPKIKHPTARRTGGIVRAFVTPAGGIGARSGATLGSASCTLLTIAGGTRATTSTSVTVYNEFTSAIGASRDIIAAKIEGIWVAIAEDCP